jgi:phytoene desaturase
MDSKVIIIGAGLTGLSAGIHLQKKGIKTEIFEISGQAGGMCTAWVRKGYRFDGCIHWMVGTGPNNPINDLYREVDALVEDNVIYNSGTIKTEIDGTTYEIPLSLQEFHNFLLSLSPEDSDLIKELCRLIEIMRDTKLPIGAPSNITELISILKYSRGFISVARKYVGVSVKEYAERFKNPVLKSLIYDLMPPQYSMVGFIMMLGTRMGNNAGYPMGGAYGVISRMENKYRSLGGEIHFNSKVDEIVVENGKAVAVKSKGSVYKAAAVIAACDMYDTLKNMLGGKYKHPQLDTMLETAELFEPLVLVSFGLNRRLNLPYSQTLDCPEGITTAPDYVNKRFNIRSFEFDPAAAPENCSSVMVMLGSKLDYWQNLRKADIDEYKIKKQQLAEKVAEYINQRIPGFKDAIEVIDVATPATYMRYANLYKGSWEGFAPTPELLKINIRKNVKGVKGLYLSGQWTTMGGGICTAVASGKSAAKSVLKYI